MEGGENVRNWAHLSKSSITCIRTSGTLSKGGESHRREQLAFLVRSGLFSAALDISCRGRTSACARAESPALCRDLLLLCPAQHCCSGLGGGGRWVAPPAPFPIASPGLV